jgi:hypothetical protein
MFSVFNTQKHVFHTTERMSRKSAKDVPTPIAQNTPAKEKASIY